MSSVKWNLAEVNEERVNALHKQLNISKSLCRILVNRGFDDFDKSKDFFRPNLKNLHSPWLMKDMDKAVERIISAIDNNEKILVFGDYDVDGTTAVALMYDFLSNIYDEEKLDFYVPHRYREGYGLSKMGVDFAKENNFDLIITLDCGIKSVELVEYGNSIGIDFIICDHHLPGNIVPNAIAVLNAKQVDCNYPFKELCGCGVGFKLISALAEKLNSDVELVEQYLDLVAIAIAADIVPIEDENRTLAFFGLAKINSNPRPGIASMLELASVKLPVDISQVVFVIAPRVNAAGRMDDGNKAVKLFIEKNDNKAKEFAEMLHNDNSERREADKSITAHALELLVSNPQHHLKNTTVVYNENWHKGVVGIVASRLIEQHFKPTIVLTKSGDLIAGSARSVPGFDLYEAIYACKEYLTSFGGHVAAAGLSMEAENLIPFTEKFEKVVSETITKELLTRNIFIDAEVEIKELNMNYLSVINQMEPFGPGNMRPVFISRNVTNTGFSKIVKEQHLRFVVKQNENSITGIGFNMADKIDLLNQPFDIVYTISENEWNGNKSVQMRVIDLKPASENNVA